MALPARSPRLYLELTWSFRTARSALLLHIRSKKPEQFMAAHAAAGHGDGPWDVFSGRSLSPSPTHRRAGPAYHEAGVQPSVPALTSF